jgi:hypothetical protein
MFLIPFLTGFSLRKKSQVFLLLFIFSSTYVPFVFFSVQTSYIIASYIIINEIVTTSLWLYWISASITNTFVLTFVTELIILPLMCDSKIYNKVTFSFISISCILRKSCIFTWEDYNMKTQRKLMSDFLYHIKPVFLESLTKLCFYFFHEKSQWLWAGLGNKINIPQVIIIIFRI